jgi:fucose permease
VSLAFFVLGAALGSWVPYIAAIKLELGLSGRALGFALLSGTLGAISTMPFSGFLIHRVGSRGTVLLSGIGLLLILPMLVSAPSLVAFAGILYLMGVFYGQFDVAMNVHSLVVQRRFDRPILSAIHGCFSIGGSAAGAGASLAAGVQATAVHHLVVNSIVLAVLLFLAHRWMLPRRMDRTDDQEESPKFALPRGALIPIGLFATFSFIGEGALWDWSAVYLRTEMRTSQATAALGFGIFGFGMAMGRFVGDSLVHRFGNVAVLSCSGGTAAIGLLLSVTAPNPFLAMAGFAFAGLGLANLVPILFAASSRQPGFSAAYGLAAVTTMGYSGFLAGPPLIGFIADTSSLGASLGSVALLCLSVAAFGPKYVRASES